MTLSQILLILLAVVLTTIAAFTDFKTVGKISKALESTKVVKTMSTMMKVYMMIGLIVFLIGTIGVIIGQNPFYLTTTGSEIPKPIENSPAQITGAILIAFMVFAVVTSYGFISVYISLFLADRLMRAYEKSIFRVFIWLIISCFVLITILGSGIFYLKELTVDIGHFLI